MAVIDTLDAYWQEICRIPSLTEDEERALAVRIKQGDEKAVDRLVTANLRYVVALARQMSEHSEVSINDLISEGNVAMLVAARRWDPDKEPRFVSYAAYSVRKAMTAADEPQDIRRMSTDGPLHPGQKNTFGDMLRAGKPMTDDGAEMAETSYAISVAMNSLNERERDVMMHFYGIGTDAQMTMAEIGERMDLKRERVRQIRKTAERKLRRIMKRQ